MITVAALGTSAITRRTIAAARGVDGLRFTTVASRDAARAASLASELGLDASTLDAVLADPRIEAVYVATPNAVHAGQIRAALDAGKHVLVEKPAVATASDWDEACQRASVRGVVLLENMRIDRDPVLARIAELLPTLGPIRRVAVGLSQRSSRYDDVLAGRRVNIFDPALGGGALADIGVYVAHLVTQLFGTPTRVFACLVPIATGADGAGAALASYPGLVTELSWSKVSAGGEGGIIEGEDGTLRFDHVTELRTLTVEYRDGRRLDERPEKEPDNITYSLRRFASLAASGEPATSGGAPAASDQARTRATLALIERIRRAAEEEGPTES